MFLEIRIAVIHWFGGWKGNKIIFGVVSCINFSQTINIKNDFSNIYHRIKSTKNMRNAPNFYLFAIVNNVSISITCVSVKLILSLRELIRCSLLFLFSFIFLLLSDAPYCVIIFDLISFWIAHHHHHFS